MQPTVLCENEFVTILYRPVGHYLEITWGNLFMPSKRLRPTFDAVRDFVQQRKPRRWLCDHSSMRIISPEDQDWLIEQWIPDWRQPGVSPCVQRLAVVRSTDLFGQRATDAMTNRLRREQPALEVQQFDQRADAGAWLKGRRA
jgi:hypothetical protein